MTAHHKRLGFGSTAILLVAAACGSTTSQTPRTSTGLTTSAPWNVAFLDDECSVSGAGAIAALVTCHQLGELRLDGAQASELGRRVAALTVRQEETVGGARATLTTGPATYQLDPGTWLPLVAELKGTLTTARVAERDGRFAKAPSCPTGQVILAYNACPGSSEAMACDPPTHACGAPVAKGGACGHNGACSSGVCGWSTGACE
jgi:hypothetical protein